MTRPDIDGIQARVNKTSGAKWKIVRDSWTGRKQVVLREGRNVCGVAIVAECHQTKSGDAEFIMHAKADVPALLEYIAHLEELVKP
ncbi:MAG: hypothetical protein HC933_06370 [Pleurocapsa sp. SU_196_0]|nr:hypothetical protein [Pleurocapsa sp. SU_196_0]